MRRVHLVPGILVAAAVLAGCQQMPRKTQFSTLPQGAAQPQAGSSAVRQTRVDFWLAQPARAAGLSELKLRDGALWYNSRPVLIRTDLSSVEPRRTADDHAYVRFKFSPQGARKLADVTERFPGKLLVLTLDNSLESIYRIGQPIASGVLDIGFKSDQEAVDAVRTIAGQ